jgi:hypothetical protein
VSRITGPLNRADAPAAHTRLPTTASILPTRRQ